ncbi:hypothetical protein EDC96DRAFT_531568 [Choanephora cucurbitarum]|nr:hypothetical protein EDC96DRAFT_531568 [Choanephora cucurbitarum]
MNEKIKPIVLQHWPVAPLLTITTFGFGYHSVPVFLCPFIPTLLYYARHSSCANIGVAYVVSSIGFSLGFLGTFKHAPESGFFPGAWLVMQW